mmetsp:Transcript_900/g.2400  ORF Transcript_900/g.2400 Transcript_900/m.2400 type:complete len:202 (+) Transcript_900:1898-2503(+)
MAAHVPQALGAPARQARLQLGAALDVREDGQHRGVHHRAARLRLRALVRGQQARVLRLQRLVRHLQEPLVALHLRQRPGRGGVIGGVPHRLVQRLAQRLLRLRCLPLGRAQLALGRLRALLCTPQRGLGGLHALLQRLHLRLRACLLLQLVGAGPLGWWRNWLAGAGSLRCRLMRRGMHLLLRRTHSLQQGLGGGGWRRGD